MQGAAQHCN